MATTVNDKTKVGQLEQAIVADCLLLHSHNIKALPSLMSEVIF